uniref:Uncharacterized protein n=1 Tax=Schistocephalus solidus TaxID=70667 RepID=A0A0X3PZ43_SCHSO
MHSGVFYTKNIGTFEAEFPLKPVRTSLQITHKNTTFKPSINHNRKLCRSATSDHCSNKTEPTGRPVKCRVRYPTLKMPTFGHSKDLETKIFNYGTSPGAKFSQTLWVVSPATRSNRPVGTQ